MAYPMPNAPTIDANRSGASLIGRAYDDGSFARVLGYRRVSSQKQEAYGTSLDGQNDDLTGFCHSRRLPEPIIYTEVESASAEKEEKRFEIARLLRDARPGDVVLVPKADRFSRDILFTLKTFRDLVRRGVALWSVCEGFFPPDNQGETLLLMWAMQAQNELVRIRERTLGRRKALRSAGLFVEGTPPWGYVRSTGTGRNKERKLIVDPEIAPIIREMFDMCIRGVSALGISQYLRARYSGRRFARPWVIAGLKNRVYTGQMALTPVRPNSHRTSTQLAAEWVDSHEPIVSLETWHRAQEALTGRRVGGGIGSPNSKTAGYLLRGLMRCEFCGHVCVSRPNYGTRHKGPGYYTCRQRLTAAETGVTCSHEKYARQPETDAIVDAAALARLIELRGLLAAAPATVERGPAVDYDGRKADIEGRRKRLVGAYAAGALTLDDIQAPIAKLDTEMSDLEAERARESEARKHESPEALDAARECAACLAARWVVLPVDSKRAALAIMAERITFTVDGRPAVTWRDASAFAASVATSGAASDIAPAAPMLDAAPVLDAAVTLDVARVLDAGPVDRAADVALHARIKRPESRRAPYRAA